MFSLPVAAFLLEPVQRITRYPLLLKRLHAVQKSCPGYDEKVLDLAQISMLVAMSEKAARSADQMDSFYSGFKSHKKSSKLRHVRQEL